MDDNWFERLVGKSKRFNMDDFAHVADVNKSVQAVDFDMFDARTYESARKDALDLKDLSDKRAIDNPPWPNLIQDAFLSLWKARPDLRRADEMRPSYRVNQATVNQVMSITDFEQLRSWTKLDDWAAAMGTLSLATRLEDFFDEQKDLEGKRQELQEQENALIEALMELQRQAEEGLTEEDLDNMLEGIKEQGDQLGEAADEQDDLIQGCFPMLRRAVKQGMQDAKKTVDESEGLVSLFGTDPGQWQKLDPKLRIDLARKVSRSKTLQEVAKLVGRIKRMAIGAWTRRIIHGTDESYSVTTGRDLSQTLPSELINLADPDLEPLFWNRYVEGSLLNYQLRGTEKVARGAIICMLDNSGSMSGQPEWFGKAVALALLDIAKREGRDFYGIHFGWQTEYKEWYFPKGEVDLPSVLEYAETFFGGGTDFEVPLSRAVQILDKQFTEAGSVRGDLIMITDGECHVSKEWMEGWFAAKEQLNFKLYGMLIGNWTQPLETISDRMYRLEDLLKGDDIKEVFTLI